MKSPSVNVRPAALADLEGLVSMRIGLWKDGSVEEHRQEALALVEGRPVTTLPLVVFVAEAEGRLVGFVEVGLRSHADGCDPARPVGFLEGWYVEPGFQRRGVGRLLVERAEAWAREQGSVEMASDTWIDNAPSEAAHQALGYEIADRCVLFRKRL